MAKTTVLFNVKTVVSGKIYDLPAGDYDDLPAAVAKELQEVGAIKKPETAKK